MGYLDRGAAVRNAKEFLLLLHGQEYTPQLLVAFESGQQVSLMLDDFPGGVLEPIWTRQDYMARRGRQVRATCPGEQVSELLFLCEAWGTLADEQSTRRGRRYLFPAPVSDAREYLLAWYARRGVRQHYVSRYEIVNRSSAELDLLPVALHATGHNLLLGPFIAGVQGGAYRRAHAAVASTW